MIYTRIAGTGSYLPKKILTNQDIEKMVDTSHEWIMSRAGIAKRHIIGEFQTVCDMAVAAAQNAMDASGVSARDIELIILATCSSDVVFPANACLVQQRLNIPSGIAFDIQAACSGFLYGLSIIDQYIKSGVIKNALLIGSEAMSRVIDWQDRSTCVLFGDGAGACVLQASNEPGVLGTDIKADGHHADLLTLSQTDKIKMQGNAVFKQAVTQLKETAEDILTKCDVKHDNIDWLVPHQANIRIIQAAAKKLNLPMDKVILTLENQGNTSAASLPLALDYGVRNNQIKLGQLLLLEVFGAGLTWGSAIVRY